jgi:hypothetical protein
LLDPLTPAQRDAESAAELQIAAFLADWFEKRGRRKARRDAVRWVDRELAAWFGSRLDAALYGSALPPAVIDAMCACREAAAKSPGRPRLERAVEEVHRLHFGDGGPDTMRRKKGWIRRALGARAWREWVARLARRGQTLMTSTEAPPEILPD